MPQSNVTIHTGQFIDLNAEKAADLLGRVKANALEQGDYELIEGLINTIIVLKENYEKGKLHIKRLLKMVFGAKTEKKKKIIRKTNPDDKACENDDTLKNDTGDKNIKKNRPQKGAKGHGRNGAAVFSSAEKEFVVHQTMKPGDPCPHCKGKVYLYEKPGILIRFFGQPPVKAKIWELEKLRCNLCGAIFTPEIPPEAQGGKYDETAIAMIAISKYGYGIPFNRLENLQAILGFPLSASTQWDKVEIGADKIYRVFEQLKIEGAQGHLLFNDDTTIKILELMKENEQDQKVRKGMFTTGIVSIKNHHKIALFFTGRNHAGENIADILKNRDPQRPPPLQMCDALSRNFSEYEKVILSHCNAHSRRKFVEVVDNFPDECSYVLELFERIYENDAVTKFQKMSDDRRLAYHRKHSGPIMEEFHRWLSNQIDERKVEPNSGLGEAIRYMLEHWRELTRFLNTPGAPLDNNICYADSGITDVMPTTGLYRVGHLALLKLRRISGSHH
jgi:hypothetical protein